MNLNLTDQQALYNQVAPKIGDLKTSMDLRVPIWAKISDEKKKVWVQWDKDPIMGLSAQIVEYMVVHFRDLVQFYMDKHQ